MIGVDQNNLGPYFLEKIMGQGFDCTLAGDRHKGWRLDQTMSSPEKPGPGPGGRIAGGNSKRVNHAENLK